MGKKSSASSRVSPRRSCWCVLLLFLCAYVAFNTFYSELNRAFTILRNTPSKGRKDKLSEHASERMASSAGVKLTETDETESVDSARNEGVSSAKTDNEDEGEKNGRAEEKHVTQDEKDKEGNEEQENKERIRSGKEESKETQVSDSPETTYRCAGGQGDRSCLFRNLYYQNGRFVMYVLKGPSQPIETQRADKYEGLWKPDIEVFSSEQKITKRVNERTLIEEPGLSVLFNPLFHNNIGHALFDGLYPAFYATVKLKVQDRPWRPVVGVDPACFDEASGALAPGDLVEAYLPHPKYGRTLRTVRAKIVSIPKTFGSIPKCNWKKGMDHNGLDLGSESGGEEQCVKACARAFGCKAGVLFEGICYLKGDGGGSFHRTDRPGIKMCAFSGDDKPKANIIVKPAAGYDGDMDEVSISEAALIGKVRRRCMSEDIYKTFGMMNEMRRLFELERDCRNHPKMLIRFEEVVVGVGGAGNLIADKSGAIGGSQPPHNAMSQFRDRMLRSYGLPVDHGVQPVPADRDLNVIVISNKRFAARAEDKRALDTVIQKLNDKGGFHAEMIDWGHIGNPSNKFKEHLKKTQKADVYVSSIGTALQYVPFMRDGKIYVALGSVWKRSGQYFPTFMEQQLAGGGTPYLRTLYADPGHVLRSGKNYPRLGEDGYFAGINGTLVSELMLQAEGLLRKGFSIPVAPEENLSVEGRILVELCRRDPAACKKMIDNRNGGHGQALLWNEPVVYEVGPWRKGNLCGSAHHKLLRELRKEFGIPGYGAPEL